MKMKNDFSYYLQKFLTVYLPKERGSSSNTIDTYRYTFILFLDFLKTKNIKAYKLTISDINRSLVNEFLSWLETSRKNSIQTRNARLATIQSFMRFLQYEYPDYLNQYKEILNIPIKEHIKTSIGYLMVEEVKGIINTTSKETSKGYRDYLMIYLLYETGVRVSELINIKVYDFHYSKPYYLKVVGKGNKERTIPLVEESINVVNEYINNSELRFKAFDHLLFYNSRKTRLTRQGVTSIIKKYIDKAGITRITVTPHIFRHSKAMHLLQSDVNLVYIRDFLGHTSIQTTEVYARADSDKKRKAIEGAYKNIYPKEKPEWENNDILSWLKSFE